MTRNCLIKYSPAVLWRSLKHEGEIEDIREFIKREVSINEGTWKFKKMLWSLESLAFIVGTHTPL